MEGILPAPNAAAGVGRSRRTTHVIKNSDPNVGLENAMLLGPTIDRLQVEALDVNRRVGNLEEVYEKEGRSYVDIHSS